MLVILFPFPILFFYIITSLPKGHISFLLKKICILTYFIPSLFISEQLVCKIWING